MTKDEPMTGLDLESFLLLLRADLSAWIALGLASMGLALLVWLCWGSRRALRKCLVLSLAAHLGLALYGSTVPAVQLAFRRVASQSAERSHIRRIRVAPLVESAKPLGGGTSTVREGNPAADGSGSPTSSPRLELAAAPLRLADIALRAPRPVVADPGRSASGPNPPAPIALGTAMPRPSRPLPESNGHRSWSRPDPTAGRRPTRAAGPLASELGRSGSGTGWPAGRDDSGAPRPWWIGRGSPGDPGPDPPL